MNLNPVSIALQFLCFTFAVAAGSTDPTQITRDISINSGSSGTSSALTGKKWLGDVQHDLSSMLQTLLSILGLRNVIAAVAVVVTSLINVVVYTLREMWEANRIEEKNKPSARADRVCRRFSLAEIELATRNFSEALVIGRGGFGKVYEGLIDNGQEKVAIKRQKFTSSQGSREFLTEIEMLSELRHVNLVSLIGYCNDHGEMILVYEYMACGTLADHLYKLERGKDSCSSLSWKRRLNICIGAGRGLDYLHTGHGTIHRDVKASNILLDDNFVAKVSDFGLAKPEDRKNLRSHVSTKVKGTPGYFDPFYLSTCRLTRKTDTYAFGVVLLEVLCGRPAVDSNLDEDERILSKWALNKISQGEVCEIVVSNLRDEISADSLKTYVGVAERCLYAEPKNRPTMAQVVLQLELALEQQEGRQLPVSNEMANVSDGIRACNDAVELKMASTDVPNPRPLPEDQTNSRVVDGELPYGRKGGRKTLVHKPPRLWPWNALWSRVKPSRTNEMLLSEICEAGIKLAKFDWNTIADATNHFSDSNKIGCGGFGPVYKAVLPTGLVVAVKRLSPDSAQGHNEFNNEILSLPNLQHQNIIKLLGYCIHREERLLIYEFMENGSLDAYLGDASCECFDWQVRMKVITGIARAIFYLHRYSGQRVIYRELKPSNILLDSEMSPKLSDFGFAKILVDDQSELLSRIIGTNGYLPPEYYMHGILSTKLDVFNFGNVVLQIVSGRRNIVSPDQEPKFLPAYAWKLWKEGRAFNLIDQSLQGTFPLKEAIRFMQIGLLCIELEPHDRPNMYRVIKMLEGDEPLVEPKEPWSPTAEGYSSSNSIHTEICEAGIKLAKFDWNTIADATNHFSDSNEIGRGGFGPVYKAVLPTGLVVAVKRLSPYSRQGHNEFENEILLLPNLRHQNIIKLDGYCIHKEERLLVYEFMENGSLDAYLGVASRKCLDWQVRMKIITGIAQAILYLHRDSGQRVIYRDLKPGNILLDSEINPKLSDFGLAKILVYDQSELQTCRISGTYGYMPPEYAIEGRLSTKLAVYNFGIVVLEIVSGRINRISPGPEPMFLLDYAWKLWKEGRASDLIDQSLQDTFPLEEALRCIQVGLLCIQLEPQDRPNMYHVIKMLEGDEPLVEPKTMAWSQNAEGYSSSSSVPAGGTSNLDDTLGSWYTDATFEYDDILER